LGSALSINIKKNGLDLDIVENGYRHTVGVKENVADLDWKGRGRLKSSTGRAVREETASGDRYAIEIKNQLPSR